MVVILGVLAIACVFIVEKLGGLLALTFSLLGITGGPLLGLFSIGMLAPTVNSKVLCSSWYVCKYVNKISYRALYVEE